MLRTILFLAYFSFTMQQQSVSSTPKPKMPLAPMPKAYIIIPSPIPREEKQLAIVLKEEDIRRKMWDTTNSAAPPPPPPPPEGAWPSWRSLHLLLLAPLSMMTKNKQICEFLSSLYCLYSPSVSETPCISQSVPFYSNTIRTWRFGGI